MEAARGPCCELSARLEAADEISLESVLVEFFRIRLQLLERIVAVLTHVGDGTSLCQHCTYEPAQSAAQAATPARLDASAGEVADTASHGVVKGHEYPLRLGESGHLRTSACATSASFAQTVVEAPVDRTARSTASVEAAEPLGRSERTLVQGRSETDEFGMQMTHMSGVPYPHWFREDAVRHMRRAWSPKKGDVIVASAFPLRGLQRLLVALIEGRPNPWEADLLDKPYLLEAGASRRGVEQYLEQITSWPGRRCFKTHAMPHTIPCRWPPCAEDLRMGVAPKIAVVVADPRYSCMLLWECLQIIGHFKRQVALEEFIEAVFDNRWKMFGGIFAHGMAWAQEAASNPDSVRFFNMERFASLDPKEVKAVCLEFAEFVGLPAPDQAATRVVEAMANRPAWAAQALGGDMVFSPEAINGGPLVELLGPRLQSFETSLAELSYHVQAKYREFLTGWMNCHDQCLVDLAQAAARGVCSIPPARLCSPMKGAAVHSAGLCRPCIFALRGTCRYTADMCALCHAEGHSKTKRPSHAKRKQRRARCRTPSPGGLSS